MLSMRIALIVLFINIIPSINMGANNLHKIGKTSSVEIIGSDLFFEIIEPEELKYTYRTRPANDFGTFFNNKMALGISRLVPVEPADGCGWPKNAKYLRGSVALVQRGECSFLSKTLKAEEVGAVAVIIDDNEESNDDKYISMIYDKTLRKAKIPATFLLGKNGYIIRKTLQKLNLKEALIRIPVNLTYVPIHKMQQPPWVPW